jgi:hypothetical protein
MGQLVPLLQGRGARAQALRRLTRGPRRAGRGAGYHFSPRYCAVNTHSTYDSRYVPCDQSDTRE